MKIGIFASNEYPYPTPPGTIQAALSMAGLIAEGLVGLGDETLFFCAEDSKTRAQKISLGSYSMYHDKIPEKIPGMLPRNHVKTMYIQKMFSDVIAYLQENPVDILQLHNIRETLPFLRFLPDVPVVLTMNDNPFEPHHKHYLMEYRNNYPQVSFISISKNQRRALPSNFKYAGNVYNGIEVDKFSFDENGGEGIISVGRFLKKKGSDVALRVALDMDKKITTVGFFPWNEEKTSDFYQEVSGYLKDKRVTHYDRVHHDKDIPKIFASAKLFLFPLAWEEPFGLTMVESMACGTPVVAFARGSVPEIIKDGRTGFIVNFSEEDKRGDWIVKKAGIDGLKEALDKIYSLSKGDYLKMRKGCRRHVEDNFSVSKMVLGYKEVYQKVINDFKKQKV